LYRAFKIYKGDVLPISPPYLSYEMVLTDYGEGLKTWEMLYKAAMTTNEPDKFDLL